MDSQGTQQPMEPETFDPKYRIDEEYEYYTELATNAGQLWIESVLRKRLPYQDDFRKSLEDGVILCELLNTLRPGCIKKINRLPSKIAGIDNLTIFLQTCSDVFSLHEKQLFQVTDLDDLAERAIPANQLADEQGKRIRRVLATVYYLGKAATGLYDGTPIDLTAFAGIVAPCPAHSIVNAGNSQDMLRETSAYTSGAVSEAEKKSMSGTENASPLQSSGKTAVVRQNTRTSDQSPSRVSDAGSFDSSSNPSSNQGTQSKEQNLNANVNRNVQNRPSQTHHFVKSGFVLPTGPSNLTKTAVEQMRLINASRASAAFQAPIRQSSVTTTNSRNDDDAWQSDLDMWRLRRKQSLQSTLPAEVLESVGLLDDGSDGSQFSADSSKKSNKKPGLLSKLRYSFDQDDDPVVVADADKKERKNSLTLPSSLKEQLPPIADAVDSTSPSVVKTSKNSNSDAEVRNDDEKEEVLSATNNDKSDRSSPDSVCDEQQDSGHKDIVFTIKQAPGNLRGFGFSIKGGRDSQLPLTIDRVTAGSAADEADVHADDEILKINNESVALHFRPTINRLIQQCVKAGQICLTVRRCTQLPEQQISTSTELPSPKSLTPQNTVSCSATPGPVDSVDRGISQQTVVGRKVGAGSLTTEQESKIRSVESLLPLASNLSLATESSMPPQIINSPVLSSGSSSLNIGQQRVKLGITRSYREGSPLTSSSTSSNGKDETVVSAPANQQETPSRLTRSNGSGAILVRGVANNQVPTQLTTSGNDQLPSANGNNAQQQSICHHHNADNNKSQIPQSSIQNNNNSQPNAPLRQQQQLPDAFNGSAKKENGVTPESAPQTPPQLPRSVSSRELCAACSQSLGAGPAMAIERLGLFYHVRCFRCSVCKVSLSNGQTGVDVRVKGSRLHCQNCNSSDESGLQSSQV